jgi:hypothetical protein
MNRIPESAEKPTPDEQPKSDGQPQDDGQQKADETPPPKPKWIPDPRYFVDLTEKEAGRGFAIIGARGPRPRKKSGEHGDQAGGH